MCRKTCNVVGDLDVADHKAIIGHGVQWPLAVPDDLKLTVPRFLEGTIVGMLSRARRGLLSSEELTRFASEWEMLTVEMSVEGDALPGLFLVRREDSAAVVVAAWPKLADRGGAPSSRGTLDAAKFFESVSSARPSNARAIFFDCDGLANTLTFRNGVVQWSVENGDFRQVHSLGIGFNACEAWESERYSLTGPFGCVAIAEPPAGPEQRDVVEELVSLALEHGVRVHHAAPTVSPSTAASPAASPTGSAAIEMYPRLPKPESDAMFEAHGTEFRALPVSAGDTVEVHYEGEWLSGVLKEVDDEGNAHIICDVDAEQKKQVDDPDIITVAPLRKVRAASFGDDQGEHGMNESVSQ